MLSFFFDVVVISFSMFCMYEVTNNFRLNLVCGAKRECHTLTAMSMTTTTLTETDARYMNESKSLVLPVLLDGKYFRLL